MEITKYHGLELCTDRAISNPEQMCTRQNISLDSSASEWLVTAWMTGLQSIPGRGRERNCSLPQHAQTGSGTHPASILWATWDSFP